MNDLSHNDQPILTPSEDRFGIDPFAAALAKSILKIQSPTGSVIALNGPWGSGKSSALNLIRHHLDGAVKAGDVAVIDFTCWWFRGEEALALAFFRELYAGMSPTLGEKLKKSLPKLGARLLKAGAVLGGAADLAGAGGAGGVAGGAMEWLGGLIQQEEGVEKLHADLSKALAEQPRRFLVVIDDIDRLSPDEALLIFRLVKSVGRLPNVMYLLVYDRQLAEKIVSERFPSEGPHYLEKIVQAAFELPEPMTTDVHRHLLAQIGAICGDLPQERLLRFMNIFHEGVAPEMRTPRDVARFTNSLAVTWPAVAGEVDPADFVALEVLRLLHPDIYRSVRQNKDRLCHSAGGERDDRGARAREYEDLLLRSSVGAQRERLRNTMMRLFPVLEAVWGNMHYGGDFGRRWAAERRVCSASHFDAYFRFAIGAKVLSAAELDGLIAKAHDSTFIAAEMRRAALIVRPSGGTKAAVILDELNLHAEKVDVAYIEPLLTGLFAVADEINVEADRGGAFSMASNELRLHWLLRSLTRDRLTLDQRSAIYVAACQTASLGWLASFADSAWTDYHPREGKEPEPEDKCLTTAADAETLRKLLGNRIADASKDASLLKSQDLAYLLYRWSELANDDGAVVKQWTSGQLATDEGVKQFAVAFTSYSWSQGLGMGGLGDLVARRTTRAQVKGLDRLMDVAEFRRRVEEVAAGGSSPEVSEFLEAWRRQEQGSDD
ncbi:MAG: NTPase [Acidovorax sp. SCN 65-108]|nr:MAG: NTPase [Acidovorax sp. SCN 65-108]OJV69633.1 MAG: NTPase [Burkholderiales bacterium 64-34]